MSSPECKRGTYLLNRMVDVAPLQLDENVPEFGPRHDPVVRGPVDYEATIYTNPKDEATVFVKEDCALAIFLNLDFSVS